MLNNYVNPNRITELKDLHIQELAKRNDARMMLAGTKNTLEEGKTALLEDPNFVPGKNETIRDMQFRKAFPNIYELIEKIELDIKVSDDLIQQYETELNYIRVLISYFQVSAAEASLP
jgi:hypothetical protein